MCTNGSRSDMLTPANARRTGNPSPSKPLGAVVTDAKGRSVITVESGSLTRGRAATLSTVTAGMEVAYQVQGDIPPGCSGTIGGADSGTGDRWPGQTTSPALVLHSAPAPIARNQAHRWNRQSGMTRSAPLFRHSGTQHGAPHGTLPTIVHAGTNIDLTGVWLVRVKRLRRPPRSALSEEQALADA